MKIQYIQHLLDEIESFDQDLLKHYERVAMLSYVFGKELELDGQERERLYWLGFLHEIGKFKNEDIKTYPIVSALLLKGNNEFYKLSNIIEQVEENSDGSGFPYQKTGDEIHLYASIVHICDYFDHLRSAGNSYSECIKILKAKNNIIAPKKLIIIFNKMMTNHSELKFDYQ
jgi:HD-GYP domain-containing protein (c-di-GMP phosphodiesterase class II)